MFWPDDKMRGIRIPAVCALTLGCALSLCAAVRPDSGTTSNTAPTAQSSRKTHSTSSHKRHYSRATVKKSASKTTSGRSSSSKSSHRRRRKKRVRGQQKIDADRVQEIQQALIREHYLSGEPSGKWDEPSEAAMRRYQADHGWQSKTVPDSRALISLGLGPSKDHLLNPESAMTTVPDSRKSDAAEPASHTSPAAAEPVVPTSSTPPTTSAPATTPTTSTPPTSDPGSPQ